MAKAVEFEIKIKGNGGEAIKSITIEASNADEAIGKIVESASRAGDSLRAMAENALVFDTAIRAVQKLKDVVSELATPFNSFETSMRAANTMAGKSGKEYEELTDQIVALSKSIPMAREELANGLYQVISNGVPEDNWLEFLEQSSKAAVGGIADLGQTVTVTSTLIKNYGLEWNSAAEIQDKIQMTAKNGVTSFEQLGQALPRVSGSASQLGVSMNELMAVFATTTGVTGNTAEVSTQLAAVLNSLIKPSSEAQAAAAAMGISFDAASVRACGGFENFLKELDSSVQSYAAESGQLSETIYGQLFGSAEALRLLGSLTGEQKDKFSENIAAMTESAGSIAGAYDNMSSTGESFSVILQNQIQSFMDWAGSIASSAAPMINVIEQLGTLALSVTQLSGLMSKLVGVVKSWNLATLAASAAQKIVMIATKAWSVAQVVLNAVLTANPIGIIVMAIAALVAIIITAYKNCDGFRRICDAVWAVVKTLATAVWNHLVAAFEKVSAVVKKAWEWVKKFFGISDENSAKQAAADLDKQNEAIKNTTDATKKATEANKQATANGLKAKEAIDWQKMSYTQLGEAIDRQKAKVAGLAGTNAKNAKTEADKLAKMEARYKKLGTQYNLSDSSNKNEYDGKHLIAKAKSYKELGNNITYYQNKLEKTNPAEKDEIKRLSQLIIVLTKSQDAIKRLQASFSQPASLDTLSDIEAAISYQKSLLENASKDQMASINKEITNLEALKVAMEDAGHVEMSIDSIKTYEDLEKELSYYETKQKRVTGVERQEVTARINELKRLKQSWDEELAALDMPEDITKLTTINALEQAISYYQARMKNATEADVAGIQRTISALEAKSAAIKRVANLTDMTIEVSDMKELTGKKLKMQLELIGVDGIKKKIAELQAMLDDKKNPLNDAERTEVKRLIGVWKDYGKQVKMSGQKLNDAWGSIKGVGSGIEGITDAVKGDGNAWQKTTSVVDNAIGVYQSFEKIAQMVKVVVDALGLSKKAEKVATVSATTATATGAAVKASSAATEASAASTVTNAEIAEASAKTFAAHASIPWVGIAIAGGLIATMTGLMFALPKFANGGIAYGPTLGIFGEYAGAANNPEVVAPLNKLKDLIEPQGTDLSGVVKFRIDGRTLYGILEKENRIRNRTK
jgi:TP901 family phage tail tape measure protein